MSCVSEMFCAVVVCFKRGIRDSVQTYATHHISTVSRLHFEAYTYAYFSHRRILIGLTFDDKTEQKQKSEFPIGIGLSNKNRIKIENNKCTMNKLASFRGR